VPFKDEDLLSGGFAFGQAVRVVITPETVEAGIAGLVGTISGGSWVGPDRKALRAYGVRREDVVGAAASFFEIEPRLLEACEEDRPG
jgi:hypothetical protein